VNVHPPAVNTDSAMGNRNLLLSESALVNSNPQLEIYCDEVSCTHCSTTGQIDEDALFYFRSRGIPKADALQLLVSGFANEVLDVVNVEEIQDYLKNRLNAWIS
jgi:Fe-S cluster assembly protein SufD